MVKKYLFLFCLFSGFASLAQNKAKWITNLHIHIGNGKVIENGMLAFQAGKLIYVGTGAEIRLNRNEIELIDGRGAHAYPGFIALNTVVGLNEIDAARATRDYQEVGAFNSNVRALTAFNSDSKIIPTLTINGISHVQAVPSGGLISGTSSLLKLNGKNWQDAVEITDDALWLRYPNLPNSEDPSKDDSPLQRLDAFFAQAAAYARDSSAKRDLRLEAMKPFTLGLKPVFLEVSDAASILSAIAFAKKWKLKAVLCGADDAIIVKEAIAASGYGLLLRKPHRLPNRPQDDVDATYKQAAELIALGIKTAISVDGSWEQRNLPFNAGTLVAYGLNKEQALASITLFPATLMGVDQRLGSLEVGKQATVFISSGDALDMKSNQCMFLFIDGEQVNIQDQQKELYERYKKRYGIKN
jgi:imidazolonepropionase-like amidohydrolase